jgi:3-oxoacyl-[acyl-carrier protein] reductase
MVSRVVLVTGATGVLGSEIVRVLAADFSVVALFHHDDEAARRLQSATGCGVRRCDVTDEDAVEAVFKEATPLYGVIHAAGIGRDALLLRQTQDDWRDTLRVNADGAFLVTRAALRHLSDGGRLVLLASRAGLHGGRGQAAYAASKAAVLALMRCAAREGAARDLAVNAICPGFVPSALSAHLNDEVLAEYRRQSVRHEFGTAHSAAAAVRWLLSEAAREVSGQTIPCHSRL